MRKPVWIRVPNGAEAFELTDAFARFGVRGVPFTSGDGWYVRVPDARSVERVLDELAVLRVDARRAHRRRAGRTGPRGTHLRRAPSSPPPHAA